MNILNGRADMAPKRKAFTLIEAVIALAVSAFVLSGMYVMFKSVIDTKEGLEVTSDNLIILQALQQLIARDIRMLQSAAVADLPADPYKKRVMAISTQNSLTFNKAIPVDVIYEVDNDTLFRYERQVEMEYLMKMPLLHNVTDWEVHTYDGREYKEDLNLSGYIYKFSFTYNGRKLEFITGRPLEVRSE